jgi:hypothetical protein
MTEHIRERINRKLDSLAEDRLYQVLDFVEYMESKYAARQNPAPNPLQKFAEGIEDKLRAGRVSAATISETMGLLNRAVGVLNGVAAAGKSVATDLASAAQRMGTAVADVATAATATPPATGPGGTGPGGTGQGGAPGGQGSQGTGSTGPVTPPQPPPPTTPPPPYSGDASK